MGAVKGAHSFKRPTISVGESNFYNLLNLVKVLQQKHIDLLIVTVTVITNIATSMLLVMMSASFGLGTVHWLMQ